MFRKARRLLTIAALLSAIMMTIIGCSSQQQSPASLKGERPDQVTLNLNWLPEYPYYWAALDKGFWAAQNLEVKIIRGYGSGDTITKIATKQAEFGIADLGTLILAHANEENIRVKAIANYLVDNPAVIIYRASSNIKVPKDLEGKTVVGAGANTAYAILWPAFTRAAGIDQDKVQWKSVDGGLTDVAFAQGEGEALSAHAEDIPGVEELIGEPVKFFSYKDEGKLNCYADSLITHEDTISTNPDLVRRFVAGFLQGIHYCLANPEEVGQIVKKYVPESDPEAIVKSWQAIMANDLIVSEESREKGLGWMSHERMIKTIELISDAYKLQKEITPEMIYTTEFMPQKPIFPPEQ
ncbi:MAG: ABC transporter substrate-binding protein [Clostridia bacterium]|nr:ABC transporter substrate-binding protein [Clostridia bacterium]